MSSESALWAELLLDEALETDETLLTLRDLKGRKKAECKQYARVTTAESGPGRTE